MQTTVKYYGIHLTIDYTLEGKYYPATYEQPEEFPDIIVNSIKAEDSEIDLREVLGWEKVDEIIDLIEL